MKRSLQGHVKFDKVFRSSVAVLLFLGGLLLTTRAIGADQDSSLAIKGEKLYVERQSYGSRERG